MRLIGKLVLATIVFVCLAAAMIAILESPAVQRSESDQADATEGASTTPRPEGPAGVSPIRNRNAIGTNSRGIAAVPPLPAALELAAPIELEPVMLVRKDSVPVFSNNSEGGSVVRRLAAGEEVETGVTILNSEGLWVEVKLDRRPFGFVRGEDLGLN